MLGMLVRFWKVENNMQEILKESIDLTVPICYGIAATNRLATGTVKNFERVPTFLETFPETQLAFGNCPYICKDSEKIESKLKGEMFPWLSSMRKGPIEINNVLNSIKEAKEIRRETRERKIEPKRILLLTGEIHSRRAKRIWKHFFPKAQILVSCTGYQNEVDSDHIVKANSNIMLWFAINVVASFVACMPFGIQMMENMHHVIRK